MIAVLALTAVPAAAATSADQQLAEAGVLQLSDFPSGWQAERAPRRLRQRGRRNRRPRSPSCKAFIAFSAANEKNPRAKSANFDLGQSNVTNTVSVYPTTAKAEAAVTMFRNPKLPQCLERLFTAVFTRAAAQGQEPGRQGS